MAKGCEYCKKSTMSGQRKRHHHATGWLNDAPRSKRTFKPNLRSAVVSIDGKKKKMQLCMKCYKTLTTKVTKAV